MFSKILRNIFFVTTHYPPAGCGVGMYQNGTEKKTGERKDMKSPPTWLFFYALNKHM